MWKTVLQAAYDLCATVVIFPLIVWLAASSQVSGALACTFTLLGLASYGVYILQALLMPVRSVLDKIGLGIGKSLPVEIDFIVFAFVFAVLAERYFDPPIRVRSHAVDVAEIVTLAVPHSHTRPPSARLTAQVQQRAGHSRRFITSLFV